jgi:LmbE family N-acetylglucosaminyl deacetylase
MQDAQRNLFHRQIVAVPEVQRPLFLAPHPDDVEIGCGGTLLELLAAKVAVRLVYLTDGRAAATDPAARGAMAATRAREAAEVSRRLGLGAPRMLGWDETTMGAPELFEARAAELAHELDAWQPDAVFVPYLWDQHQDHRIANVLLARAMTSVGRDPRVYGYEIWSAVPPGLVVDISAQLARKIELVGCYPSQLALFPYQQLVDVVNRTHAALAGPGCTAAEVFCPFDGAKFRALLADVDLLSPATLRNEVLTTPPDTW